MEIQKIEIGNEGYIHCHSRFYSSQDCLSSNAKFSFVTGINRLYGEIDSGIWAISYLLSMYSYRQADFILFKQPEVVIDDKKMLLDDAMKYSCYMDNIYPLFSSDVPIKKIVTDRLNETESKCYADDIKDMFCIDNQRFKYWKRIFQSYVSDRVLLWEGDILFSLVESAEI